MKIIEKKEIKGIIRIIAFCLVAVIMLEVLSQAVFKRGDAATYNNKYSNAYAYLLEPENTLQVACFGNSDLYSAIVPNTVWETSGIASTMVASPLQSIRQTNYMLEELLKVQSPTVVVIETDMLYEHSPDRNRNYEKERNSQSNIDIIIDKADTAVLDDFVKSKFSIFVFHDKWKALFKSKKSAERDKYSHGYHVSVKVFPFERADYMVPSEYEDAIKATQEAGLKEVISLCKKNGIEVLLMELPSESSWSYERHNCMTRLAEENDVKFIDFNLLLDEIEIDENTDFRDRGNHMNYYGAKKVSAYFAKYLAEKYNLEDKRGDEAYAFWDESCVEFEKIVAKEEEEQKNKA